MKLLDRYIILNFIRPFIFSLLTFTSILILTEWLGMVGLLVRMKTPLSVTLEYLCLRFPSILFEITPSALLLAILFGFNELGLRGEITAMSTAGLSNLRISLPIFIIAMGISIVSFFFTGFIGARFNDMAHKVMEEKIWQIRPKTKMYDISLRGQDNLVYHFGVFDMELNQIKGITIIEDRGGGPPTLRIDAESANWQGGGWYLFNGAIRRFDKEGKERSLERFNTIRWKIKEGPEDIWRMLCLKGKRSDNMTLLELLDYIKFLKVSKIKFRDRLTDLYLKFLRPLANFVIAIIGISLVFSSGYRRMGKVAGFGIAVIVSFLYWGIMAISRSLGHAGILPPLFSASLPNILFLGLGVGVFWRVRG